MYFYDIKVFDFWGFTLHYFVITPAPIHKIANINPIPEKVRILIDDRYENIMKIIPLTPFSYFYKKYIKRDPSRVNWEKEKI